MRHMKNRVVLVSALLASTGLVAMAAGIDGKWTVTTQGRQGDQTQTLTLSSSGMTLKGSLDAGNGMPTDITEGMIHDADVTFKVTRMGRDGNPQVTNYKGTLAGDELKLTGTREAPAGGAAPGGGGGGGGAKGGGGGGGGRGPQELTFKRAK
jgi:hypothetical protein